MITTRAQRARAARINLAHHRRIRRLRPVMAALGYRYSSGVWVLK